MIMYPFTWKYEMGVELHQVRQHIEKAGTSGLECDFDDASAWLERFLIISAFTVRRLSESDHLSIDLNKRDINVLSIPKRKNAPAVTFSNWQELTANFQMEHPEETTVSTRHLCNQLIHSFILLDCAYEDNLGKLSGFIVSSDREREQEMLHTNLKDYFVFLEDVIIDGSEGYVYNSNTGFVEKTL